MKERFLVGLDIGSSAIRLAIGQRAPTSDRQDALTVIGAVEAPSQGISKGCISSLEDTVSAVTAALEQAERVVGVPLQEAYVAIGGTYISVIEAKGVIGVSRQDGDIRTEDVARALESARAFINPANQEILHILPRDFSVDGQRGIKDPVGMQGIRLEVDVHVIQGLSSHVRNVTKAVFRTGLDIAELVYAPLAAAESVTQQRQRDVGVCVVNIGATTTGVAVYEEGQLLHGTTLPIGADHVTSDIAIGLRISLDVAEQIKRAHGHAVPMQLSKRDEIDVAAYGADQSEVVSVQYVSEIIEARVEELFEKIEAELKKIDRAGMLPAGIVLTGGGAKLPGMVDVAKRVLHLPAMVGAARVPTLMPDLALDPSFATAVGLVMWGDEAERVGGTSAQGAWGSSRGGEIFKKIGGPFQKIFKSFIP